MIETRIDNRKYAVGLVAYYTDILILISRNFQTELFGIIQELNDKKCTYCVCGDGIVNLMIF